MLWSSTRWLVGMALVCQCASTGWARKYPSKPIRYLVADAAGSGSDTIGRIVATGLIPGFG